MDTRTGPSKCRDRITRAAAAAVVIAFTFGIGIPIHRWIDSEAHMVGWLLAFAAPWACAGSLAVAHHRAAPRWWTPLAVTAACGMTVVPLIGAIEAYVRNGPH